MERPSLLGRQLGEFEVVEPLGGGGYGDVFRARQHQLERDAVIKVLKSTIGPLGAERFTREAKLASQLDHPYAAHVYAYGAEPDGVQWIAMELVRGTSLAELLGAQGPMPLSRFLPLFEALCQVVHAAHDQHIVHRDIKPANVMVVVRGGVLYPKLLDFGIARMASVQGDVQVDQVEQRVERLLAAAESRDADAFDRELDRLFDERRDELAARARDQAPGVSDELYLGSPEYMAPELWLGPHGAGPACDLYALGVLAYECLTGDWPFRGSHIVDVARAHLGAALPALPAALPARLHAVLARACAKRASDRHASALQLWQAVAEACAVGGSAPLPRPPAHVTSALLARAPQPIAESLAAAEHENRPDEAWARYVELVELVCRYIGLLGLASYSRLGRREPGAAFGPLATRLAHSGLDAREWLELAAAISEPFTRMRDAFPVPELVDACHRRDAGGRTSIAAIRTLLELAETFRERKPDRDELGGLVGAIGEALAAIAELFEYDLIVCDERGGESWIGQRRRPRVARALASDVAPGSVLLVDRNGGAVLTMSPLVAAIAPMPGAEPELFMLAGSGRYGARLVSDPSGFQRQNPELGAWLERVAGIAESAEAEQVESAPYRGLAAFSVADSELFFGRERESEHLANHLRARSFAAVVGPSGAGKSSFVQAGVVPLLPSHWHAIVMRPGAHPMAALAGKLAFAVPGVQQVAELDARDLASRLDREMRRRGETLVIVVDQAEELVTLCRDEPERVAFARLIAAVRDDSRVRIVMTLRDDFLMRVQRVPWLAERMTNGIHLLGTPSRSDLRRILVEPARRAGYQLEDDALIDEMVAAVVDSSSALALLSFTAARMWDLRDRQFKKLRRKVYASIGGVGGALAQHAEDVISKMTAPERELVREAFRLLVTPDGTRAVIARAELVDALGGGAQATNVIESLVQARLAVTTEASGGITIEVTHEALLDSWPRLVAWRRDDAENARMRDQLRTSARQWDARDRQKGLLWSGDVLAEFRLWRARYHGRLTELEDAFAQACVREAARTARWRRGLVVGAFAVLVAGAGMLYVLGQHARASAREATARELEVLEEQGRRELLDRHPIHALAPLAKAYALGDRSPAVQFLLARSLAVAGTRGPVLRGHTGSVGRAAFSADGTRVVTASLDKTLRLWDATSGAQLASIALPAPAVLARTADSSLVAVAAADEVAVRRTSDLGVVAHWKLPAGSIASAIAIADDGQRVVAGDASGHVHVLDVDRPVRTFAPHSARVFSVALAGGVWAAGGGDGRVSLGSSDPPLVLVHGKDPVFVVALAGGHLAAAGADATVKIWSIDGELEHTLVGHAHSVRSLAFSPDGARLASASEDGTARLWTLASDAPPVVMTGHDGALLSVTYSRDGTQLVTTGIDATARIWDGTTGVPQVTLDAHRAEVWSATFDARGEHLVTSSYDGTARIWTVPRLGRAVARTPKGFASLAYVADGNRFIAGGLDGVARVYDASGGPIAELAGDATVRAVALFAGGTRALTGTQSGKTRLWDVAARRPLAELEASPNGALVARVRPDGRAIAVGGGDGVIRVFDAHTGAVVARIAGHRDAVWGLSYSPDGSRLASASDDRTIRIVDRDGKLVRELGPMSAEVNAVAFDPRGERLAALCSDGVLRVFAVPSGELLGERAAHHANGSAVAFSGDGERIATASFDRTVAVWDARSLRELLRLEHHGDAVLAVAAEPGSERWIDASTDGSLWEIDLPLEQRPPAQIVSE